MLGSTFIFLALASVIVPKCNGRGVRPLGSVSRSSLLHCCPLLSIVVHCCPLSPIIAHWCSMLPTVAYCCPLLKTWTVSIGHMYFLDISWSCDLWYGNIFTDLQWIIFIEYLSLQQFLLLTIVRIVISQLELQRAQGAACKGTFKFWTSKLIHDHGDPLKHDDEDGDDIRLMIGGGQGAGICLAPARWDWRLRLLDRGDQSYLGWIADLSFLWFVLNLKWFLGSFNVFQRVSDLEGKKERNLTRTQVLESDPQDWSLLCPGRSWSVLVCPGLVNQWKVDQLTFDFIMV